MKTTLLDTSMIAADGRPSGGFFSGLVAALRKGASDRALHRQLSDMDDALLRDIGLGDDEIYRLRQGTAVTPRHWA